MFIIEDKAIGLLLGQTTDGRCGMKHLKNISHARVI